MSPRRMDISSLLRDPSPDRDREPPASLLSLLNSPSRPHPSSSSPPFLGLDALVHVASEERRRISDLDHDWPSRQLHSRPHKRARDTPSPEPWLPSPTVRHHSSPSPINNYPTLRQHPSPSRSAPTVSDTRTVHTSPFLRPLHPLQPPTHPSPRNISPHRHSPQHIRSHPHSSPIQTTFPTPVSTEPDTMSPRYNLGPRMAGGIQVLSSDASSMPRPDLSNYQSPSPLEHAWHDPPKLSPLSTRTFSPLDDTHQQKAHQVESQVSVLLRERLRLRPPHFPLYPSTDNGRNMGVPPLDADSPGRPPPERHPIRVWEEQQTVHHTSRRVSPAHVPGMVSDLAEAHFSSAPGERLPQQCRNTELQHNVAENVHSPPLSISKELPPSRAPILEPLPSDSRTPIQGSRLDSQPSSQTRMQPRSPIQSMPPTHLAHPNASTSPVLDLHLKNFETQPKHSPELVDTSTSAPFTLSEPTITGPRPEQIPEVVVADTLMASSPPSPDLAQPVDRKHSAHATEDTRRSPSQRPLSALLPTKDEHGVPHENISFMLPEPSSRRSPEPEYTSEREQEPPERAMMDVDEELLSLIEDRPVHTPSTVRVESRSPLPITVGQGTEQGSSEVALSSQPILKCPSLMTDEEKDRASMPPPAVRKQKADKDKISGTTTGGKKKKDGTSSKPAAKPKQPPKPRAKPAPKSKVKPNVVDSSSKGSIPKVTVNINARSRSTSVIPVAPDDTAPEPDADNSGKEDDKLYCVCKTRYDEDRMMIACDRCDEWFHTLCVNMPDLEIDLVDQFICPPCIQKHQHLRTTWKRRCLLGLRHENPSSPEACHRPSRGAFSKYCSDDCGIKYMQAHIVQWERSGGTRDLLWESVRNAAKREGVVICAKTNGASPKIMDVDNEAPKALTSAAKRRAEREVARLNGRLEQVVKERELMKHELDMMLWREKVVELASERAGKVDECGWDQRLCFGEEEWADFGPEVLESYEEARVKLESGNDTIPLDTPSGEWWCTGKKKCERHAGWQKLRAAEVSFEKETKEGVLLKLTTREREIRKCIEDIVYPQSSGIMQAACKHPQLNGPEKLHSTDHVSERGEGLS